MRLMEFAGLPITSIASAIQLSVAPVFLLSGIGVLLGVFTNRLARAVDRARGLELRHAAADPADQEALREMTALLAVLARRARLINAAITLATVAALLVASVVALLFVSAFAPLELTAAVALLFVTSMLALVGALLVFLIEVRIATAALRIGPRAAQKKASGGRPEAGDADFP